MQEDPEPERVLEGVQSFQVGYFDGDEWLESWNSEVQPEPIPEAIRVRIEFEPVPVADKNQIPRLPIEMVLPVTSRAPVESDAAAAGESGGDTSGGGAGQGAGRGNGGGS